MAAVPAGDPARQPRHHARPPRCDRRRRGARREAAAGARPARAPRRASRTIRRCRTTSSSKAAASRPSPRWSPAALLAVLVGGAPVRAGRGDRGARSASVRTAASTASRRSCRRPACRRIRRACPRRRGRPRAWPRSARAPIGTSTSGPMRCWSSRSRSAPAAASTTASSTSAARRDSATRAFGCGSTVTGDALTEVTHLRPGSRGVRAPLPGAALGEQHDRRHREPRRRPPLRTRRLRPRRAVARCARHWLLWRPALAAGLRRRRPGGRDAAGRDAGGVVRLRHRAVGRRRSGRGRSARGAGHAVGGGLAYALVFMAAESLSRRAFGGHPQLWRVWSRDAGADAAGARAAPSAATCSCRSSSRWSRCSTTRPTAGSAGGSPPRRSPIPTSWQRGAGAGADRAVAAGGVHGGVPVPRGAAVARRADRRALRAARPRDRHRLRRAGADLRRRARELPGVSRVLAAGRALRAVDAVGAHLPALRPGADDPAARDVRPRAVCDPRLPRRRAGRRRCSARWSSPPDSCRSASSSRGACVRGGVGRARVSAAQCGVAAGRARAAATARRTAIAVRSPWPAGSRRSSARCRCSASPGSPRGSPFTPLRADVPPLPQDREASGRGRRCRAGRARRCAAADWRRLSAPKLARRRSAAGAVACVRLARRGRRCVPQARRHDAGAPGLGSALRAIRRRRRRARRGVARHDRRRRHRARGPPRAARGARRRDARARGGARAGAVGAARGPAPRSGRARGGGSGGEAAAGAHGLDVPVRATRRRARQGRAGARRGERGRRRDRGGRAPRPRARGVAARRARARRPADDRQAGAGRAVRSRGARRTGERGAALDPPRVRPARARGRRRDRLRRGRSRAWPTAGRCWR